ncbi:MAG: hypothetical protein IV108_02305 [Burkholderiales bacterium]|nr:hypothetical protein [Burkholderiales bacterium]
MVPDVPQAALPPTTDINEAADLLEGLEVLREELGSIADELIELLRQAGVTPPQDHSSSAH